MMYKTAQTNFNNLLSAAGVALAVGMNHGPSLAWFARSSQAKMCDESILTMTGRCILHHAAGQSTINGDTDADNPPLSTDDMIDEDEPVSLDSMVHTAFVYIPQVFLGLGPLASRSVYDHRCVPTVASVLVSDDLSDSDISLELTLLAAAAPVSDWVSDICAAYLGSDNSLDLSLPFVTRSAQSIEYCWLVPFLQYEDAVLDMQTGLRTSLKDAQLGGSSPYHLLVEIPEATLDLGDNPFFAREPDLDFPPVPAEESLVLEMSLQPSVNEVLGDQLLNSMSCLSPVAPSLFPASLSQMTITVVCVALCTLVGLFSWWGRCYHQFRLGGGGSLFLDTTSLSMDNDGTTWEDGVDVEKDDMGCEDNRMDAGTTLTSAAVVDGDDPTQDGSSFDSDCTLVDEDSGIGVLDSMQSIYLPSVPVRELSPSKTSMPPLPHSATVSSTKSSIRRLNKYAAVFVPKEHCSQLEASTVGNSPLRNGKRNGKENRMTSTTGSLSARARTAIFVAEAGITSSSRKNPWRGIRRKGIRDFDLDKDFCLPAHSSVTVIQGSATSFPPSSITDECSPSLTVPPPRLSLPVEFRPPSYPVHVDPVVPLWDTVLEYAFLAPYSPIPSSRSIDTLPIHQDPPIGFSRAQSMNDLFHP